MKILVLQLTRLGDILCTLPVLRALKRNHPLAEIHFLVRESFKEAAHLGRCADHIWYWDSKKLLEPILLKQDGLSEALTVLSSFISSLKAENFDRVINLSFSPSSSFVTHMVAGEKSEVTGYTRTPDFYLHIPDETSLYFRSQVGIHKSNRRHVIDLMARIAGITLRPCDFEYGVQSATRQGIVIHMGASQEQKTWPLAYWLSLIRRVTEELNVDVHLIGGKSESAITSEVAAQFASTSKVKDCAGATLNEVIRLASRSRVFIGVDSGPMHLAALSGCPVLNLSVGPVRFWETGPVRVGSSILVSDDPSLLTPDIVFEELVLSMQNKTESGKGYFVPQEKDAGVASTVRFKRAASCNKATVDSWDLVEWLYWNGPRPEVSKDARSLLAQLEEAAQLAQQQIDVLFATPEKKNIVGILDRIDELFGVIGRQVPAMTPLLDAFFTSKENIPPGPRDEVFAKTKQCYAALGGLCRDLATVCNHDQKGITP